MPPSASRAALPASTVWVLGGLIAMSAVAIDITLVAQPATTAAVAGDPTLSGLIVTAYLAGFAPGQLVWGFAGDRYGRRRAVLAGLLCFVVATVACAVATSFPGLLAARFAQGVAGGSGPVLSRAIVRDVASGASAARLLALLTAILGTAPLLAPVLGATLLAWFDWRSIFWSTAAYGGVVTVLAMVRLPESRPPAPPASARDLVLRTRTLIGERDFRAGVALVALPFGGYHTLLALYPTLAIVTLGFGETMFTWLLAAAAVCFVAGSTISRVFVTRIGMAGLMRSAIALCIAGGGAMAVGTAFGGIVWIAIGAASYMFGVGQILPLATALALRHARDAAGWAAALLGLVQIGGGALLSFIATLVAGPRISLPVMLLVCALAAQAVLARTAAAR